MRGAKEGGGEEEEGSFSLQGGGDAALAEDVLFDEEEEEEEEEDRRGGSSSLRIASFDEEEEEKRRGAGGFFLGEARDRFRRWHDQSVALQELCIVLKLAAPIAGSYLCTMFIQLVSLFFVGHLGPTELAAAALGTMYCNALGFSLIIGLLSALDTLCSQAFGAQSYHRVGLVLQRAIVILMLLCIPIAAIWFFAEELLLRAKQDPETSRLAAVYTKTMIPALPCYVLFESLKRYLMAQSIVLPTMLASILGIVVNFIGNYVLIRIFSIGFIGAPLALVITYFSVTLALWLSVYCLSLHRKTWPGFQLSQCFQGWREMFLLGLPGIVMICAEWWGFEIHALLAGRIGTNALAAHALVLNTTALCYMVPLGISLATTVRVGNLVGDLNPTRASKCARLMIYLTASEASVVALCLFAARHVWGYVFSSDDDVVAITAKILPVVVCFLVRSLCSHIFCLAHWLSLSSFFFNTAKQIDVRWTKRSRRRHSSRSGLAKVRGCCQPRCLLCNRPSRRFSSGLHFGLWRCWFVDGTGPLRHSFLPRLLVVHLVARLEESHRLWRFEGEIDGRSDKRRKKGRYRWRRGRARETNDENETESGCGRRRRRRTARIPKNGRRG
ncbi:ethionine resistance protein [Balamuthia mandrillaris]